MLSKRFYERGVGVGWANYNNLTISSGIMSICPPYKMARIQSPNPQIPKSPNPVNPVNPVNPELTLIGEIALLLR
jgi:hypothetical protein